MMAEDQGYDAMFVSDVWEDLKCVICHLVLRNPVQVQGCGHRFCTPCFVRMKMYAEKINSELLCPVDKDVVEIDKVFEDKGISRAIGCLRVQCDNYEEECTWVGDLRDLEKHLLKCDHRSRKEDENITLKDLLKRIRSCEESLLKKDKDIAQMMLSIYDLKAQFLRKDEEMKSLSKSCIELQKEVLHSKTQQQEMRINYEEQIEAIQNKNLQLEIKVLSMELKQAEGSLERQRSFEGPGASAANKLMPHQYLVAGPSDLSQEEVCRTTKQQNKIAEEIKERQENVKALWNPDNPDNLFKHIENIESVLFGFKAHKTNNLEFKWVMQDYASHYKDGRTVYSPKYYIRLNGYSLQLLVSWSGVAKEQLGVYMKVHRDRTKITPLEPFNYEYTLQVLDDNGGCKTNRITRQFINAYRDKCFSFHGEDDAAREAYGATDMLKAPYHRYVINDSLFITCKLHLMC